MENVLVAMSGGVDSSVAALLLKQQGYNCLGVTMKLCSAGTAGMTQEGTCCSLRDRRDACAVAAKLGIPYRVCEFGEEFEAQVIRRFVEAYEEGRTPNPCIDCNRWLKFGALGRFAEEQDCGAVATGHYARVERDPNSGRWLLKKGLDPDKDQSYVLYSLTQEQLAHTLFPLGGLTKAEVRAIAERNGLATAHKSESQDICFVPDGDYAAFMTRYTGKSWAPGPFVGTDGRPMGTHRGIVHYTVGQRRGIGISAPEPLYVVSKDAASNTVVLGNNGELFSGGLEADGLNLISCAELRGPVRVQAKIRYRQPAQDAVVTRTGPDTVTVRFDRPQRAVAPGQALVLYDGDTVVGGAVIRRGLRDF